MSNTTSITSRDFYKPETIATIRDALKEAFTSIEESRQKCFIVGQMFCEAKRCLPHGEFQTYIEKTYPEITYRQVNNYVKAAENILKCLPAPPKEIQVSQILTTPSSELSGEQLTFKNLWDKFTSGKSIKAMQGSFLDNDPATGLLRGTNGKIKGGVGKQPDRKLIEKFTATKLGHITTFLTIQKKMAGTGKKKIVGPRPLSPVQQAQISAAFIHFLETAPNWLLLTLHDKISTESKLTEGQRYSR